LTSTIILALPFVFFLSAKLGRFYWEGKSSINDNLVLRMSTGMGQPQANSGLGANLSEDGVALQRDQFVYAREHPVPLMTKLHLIVDGWPSRFISLLRDLWSAKYFGAPFVWILAAAGLLGGPWNRLRLVHEILLCLMLGLLLFILGSMHFIWDRFLFPVIPFLVLWAAHGTVKIYEWLDLALARKPTGEKQLAQCAAFALAGAGVLIILSVSARDVLNLGEIAEARSIELKQAGLWLATHGKPENVVMTVGMVVPYYAGATAMMLPYSDSAPALAYLHKKKFDFIVLRSTESSQRPFLPDWLQNGIPDQCAHLAHRVGNGPEHEILIYEWNCQPAVGLGK
jgi:hypothetical protein